MAPSKKSKEVEEDEDPYKKTVEHFHMYLLDKNAPIESPVDISLGIAEVMMLHPLQWSNYMNLPKKMKITNTGHTAVVSAKWQQERPFLVDGPLEGAYVFSQIHFHWGPTDTWGSDHSVDGERLPLELHVLHFKSVYLTQESALREKDGIACLVYFFKLQYNDNPRMQVLIDAITFVRNAHTSARLEPQSMQTLFRVFKRDYFMYWGSVTTSQCRHIILWMICREQMGISSLQLEQFRMMYDESNVNIMRNSRNIHPLGEGRTLYHVLPSDKLETTLLPPHEDFPKEQNT